MSPPKSKPPFDIDVIKRQIREELKNELKTELKAGIREWLDENFARFGKWSFGGVCAMAFAMVVWFFFFSHGWKLPS